jgi:hypothetical protein
VCKKLTGCTSIFERVKRKETILIKLGRILNLKMENGRSNFGKIREKPDLETYFPLYFLEKKKYPLYKSGRRQTNLPCT